MRSSIYEILTTLSSKIQTAYPVFTNGYSMVRTDDKKGLIVCNKKNEWVGLDDRKGNYFYIRSAGDFTGIVAPKTNFSDCIQNVLQTYTCTIVAVLAADYDAFSVQEALMGVITLAGHAVSKGSADMVAIMRAEMKGLKPEVIETVLAKLDKKTIVSLEFKVLRIFSPSKCTIEICKTC